MTDKLDSIMDEFDDSLWAMAAEIERLRGEVDALKAVLSDALLELDKIVNMCQADGMEPNGAVEAVHDVIEELNDVRRGNAALVAERDALKTQLDECSEKLPKSLGGDW